MTSFSLDHVTRESPAGAASGDRALAVVPQLQRGAVPLLFGPADGRCLGWYHAPSAPLRDTGVVLCRPVGWEGTSAYETFTKLAEYLADSGFAVVRFDYHGTGDSAGSDADPDRVAAWLSSIDAAIDEVQRLGQVSQIALFGVRMGATLAATAASLYRARAAESPDASSPRGISSLVMWAPCVTGRSFARELKASTLLREEREQASDGPPGNGDLEALGFLYTAQTLRDLGTLDLLRLSPLPAPEVMVIGRDDLPGEGPLPQKWRDAGVKLTYAELPGFKDMMVEVHEADVAHGTLHAITAWLSERHPVVSRERAEEESAEARLNAERASGAVFDGVRETPLLFGGEHRLFGILSERATPSIALESRAQYAILMLNVGTNHRVGPNRLYVRMARRWAAQGYRAFRFDLSGLGDSGSAAGFSATRLFDTASVADVQLAMDALAAHGCTRFIVIGLCSGAFVAFQSVLADPRVVGQVLMNPRRLVGKEGKALQQAMSQSFKSTQFYLQRLFEPSTYTRLLQGEIDVRGIAGRLRVLAELRAQRVVDQLLRRQPAEGDVLALLRRACGRGVDALFIVSEQDDGLDYLELQLGPKGRYMRAFSNFRMQFIKGGDHTFSRVETQHTVIDLVLEHLNRLTERS